MVVESYIMRRHDKGVIVLIKYKVTIQELLEKEVEFEFSEEPSGVELRHILDKVREDYYNEKIILDADDFLEVSIVIKQST